MKIIQDQNQRTELKKLVEKIVQELGKSGLYKGTLSIERVLPPLAAPADSPAGHSHLMVQEETRKKFLGLIPYTAKEEIFLVKEGFYDKEDNGSKNMYVRIISKNSETIVKKHLEEYGGKNQVTKIVYV